MNLIAKSLIVFLFFLGIFYLTRAHSTLHDDIYQLRHTAALNAEQRQYFVLEINHHEREAKAYLKKAEQTCWYFPTLDDQEKARYCFTSAMAMAAPGTPWSKIIAAVLVGITNYGLDVLEQSELTEEYLRKAEYHFEMKEFFEGVLING